MKNKLRNMTPFLIFLRLVAEVAEIANTQEPQLLTNLNRGKVSANIIGAKKIE